METNFFGPHRLIRAALPGFRTLKTGTIINISSIAGIDAPPSCSLYAASKFALEGMPAKAIFSGVQVSNNHVTSTGLSESLARKTAPFNINILIVEPGAFRTDFLLAIAEPSKPHTEDYKSVRANKS